jgi:rubrerythrin
VPDNFNADEIFEVAEQIERNGAKFYRAAAELARLADSAAMLRRLADMEDRHRKIFAAMREKLWRENPEWLPKFFNPKNENLAAQYMRSLASGLVFDPASDPGRDLGRNDTPRGVLSVAIGLEKDSIIFYLGVKDAVPADEGRDRVDQIIHEEMMHINLLTRELSGLRNGLP